MAQSRGVVGYLGKLGMTVWLSLVIKIKWLKLELES